MADGRRQSANSRTSTPKPGLQGPGDLDEVLSKAVGARIRITTAAPSSTTLEGSIFAACRTSNLIAINTAPTPSSPSASNGTSVQPGDYHLIPISRIQSFNLLSLPPNASASSTDGSASGFENLQPAISRVDLKSLEAREEAAIRKVKEKDATKGKGVSKEAQEIFDALHKTLPTRWHDTAIIVMDAVMITKPYTPDNCSAPKDQQNALVRVKKVLENERKKIADRANRAAAVATPLSGIRKGG